MRIRVTGTALAIAIAVTSAVCFAGQGVLIPGESGCPERVAWAKTPDVLAAYTLATGESLVRAIDVNGYSRVRLKIGAEGVLPGEVVNVGMRFGPVGNEARGEYGVHQQAIGTALALGESAPNQTATVLGPTLFLSFENRTGHEVVIPASVQQIAWPPISVGQLPRTSLVISGEEMSSAQGLTIVPFLQGQAPAGVSAAQTVEAVHRQAGLAIATPPLLASGVGDLANTLPLDAVETQNADGFLHFAGAQPSEPALRRAFYVAVYGLVRGKPSRAVRQAPLAGTTTAKASFVEEDLRRAASPSLRRLLAVASIVRNPLSGLRHPPQNLRVSLFPRPRVEWSKRF